MPIRTITEEHYKRTSNVPAGISASITYAEPLDSDYPGGFDNEGITRNVIDGLRRHVQSGGRLDIHPADLVSRLSWSPSIDQVEAVRIARLVIAVWKSKNIHLLNSVTFDAPPSATPNLLNEPTLEDYLRFLDKTGTMLRAIESVRHHVATHHNLEFDSRTLSLGLTDNAIYQHTQAVLEAWKYKNQFTVSSPRRPLSPAPPITNTTTVSPPRRSLSPRGNLIRTVPLRCLQEPPPEAYPSGLTRSGLLPNVIDIVRRHAQINGNLDISKEDISNNIRDSMGNLISSVQSERIVEAVLDVWYRWNPWAHPNQSTSSTTSSYTYHSSHHNIPSPSLDVGHQSPTHIVSKRSPVHMASTVRSRGYPSPSRTTENVSTPVTPNTGTKHLATATRRSHYIVPQDADYEGGVDRSGLVRSASEIVRKHIEKTGYIDIDPTFVAGEMKDFLNKPVDSDIALPVAQMVVSTWKRLNSSSPTASGTYL